MKLESLQTLLEHELADLASAESQLPKLAKAADSPDLKEAFENHLRETQTQAERIKEIIASLESRGSSLKSHTCKAMEGLIKEGSEILKATGDPSVIDAGLIAAAQRVEHYEIAAYGCARTYAELLGMEEAAQLLQESLDEEKAADQKLNELALNLINQEAAGR